tara:strand:+ start:286 stop:1152 length:867 start_codon:yes stop_codon:yes gene_type:complete
MMHSDTIDKARVLVESLPYIKEFFGKTIVIKYGGSLMVDDAMKQQFAQDVVLLKYVGINPIIVHGGGKDITKWLNRIGKETVFIDGLRVTDSETMEVTEMVLSGKINSDIVTLINEAGGKAVGLSGKDGHLFQAKRLDHHPDKDIGLVGTITQINDDILTLLATEDYIPVVASIARGQGRESLNINADNVASEVAIKVGAHKLVYLTDVDGILIDNAIQGFFNYADAKALLNHEQIAGGMRPKLQYALNALEQGVHRVHILNGMVEHAVLLELFMDNGIGTCLSRDNR